MACKSPAQQWYTSLANTGNQSDKVFNIDYAKLPFDLDTTSLSYRIRLSPTLQSSTVQGIKENFLYRVDSCFYIQIQDQVIYPELCQAINGGITNTYEYLVSFSLESILHKKDLQLHYQDKFLNKKNYSLLLSKP